MFRLDEFKVLCTCYTVGIYSCFFLNWNGVPVAHLPEPAAHNPAGIRSTHTDAMHSSGVKKVTDGSIFVACCCKWSPLVGEYINRHALWHSRATGVIRGTHSLIFT